MKSFSSFSIQVLSKSLIGLAAYPLLSSFLKAGSSQDENDIFHHGNLMNLKNLPSPWEEHDLLGGYLGFLRSGSFNYLVFMVIMLTFDGLIQIISKYIKKPKEDRGCAIQHFKSPLEKSKWRRDILRAMIIYTVVYCFGQILTEGFKTLFCSITSICLTQPRLIKNGELYHREIRLMEEIEPINDDYEQQKQSEGISLSLGKVISSLNLGANHIVVTKDMKYAFAALSVTGALKVIDLSNFSAPSVVKTLVFTYVNDFSRQKFLYLSPDEKTLFVSCFERLDIIDVTNPEFAYNLASVEDEKFINSVQSQFKIRLSVSFALSADSKTLFVGGLGLQTFDISDLGKPILLDSQFMVSRLESYFLLTIAATADRKTLWVANGTLDSYDISDARNKKLINSLSDANILINSIMLSCDNKTAFGLNTIGSEKIQIIKLNITNPASPSRTQSFVFAQKSLRPAWIMALSQKERYLFITTDQGVINFETVVFDLIENRRLKEDDESLLKTTKAVMTLPRENYILASDGSKTMILEFYHNYPNKEIFSLTNYPIWTIEMTKKHNNIEFSQGENYLFVAGSEPADSGFKSLFEIYDSRDRRDLHLLSSLEVEPDSYRLTVSTDLRRACLITKNKLLFLDISNFTAPSVYSEYNAPGFTEDFEEVTLWTGSNIAFILVNGFLAEGNTEQLIVMDYSDPELPQEIWKLTWSVGEEQNSKMNVYQKRDLLFITGSNLEIFNISDVRNPHKISSVNLSPEQTEYINFAEASHDFKTFFIETVDRSSFHKLKIYDISDSKNPRFLSELILPMSTEFDAPRSPLLSGDSRTIYMLQKKDILAIDVSNRKAPRIFGLHPINMVYEEGILQTKLSGDSYSLYLMIKNGKMHSMNLKVPQTLFLNQEEFYIGQHYSDNPIVLKLDKESEYKVMQASEYKISRLSLFEVKVDPTADFATPSLMALPGWAKFDETNKRLTIEPRKQVDLGYYTLCATIFNKVPASAFSFFEAKKAKSLLTELILLGYLDKQHFLTSEMGSSEEFNLNSDYNEDQKEQIYEILNESYVLTCTTIHILPSLKMEMNHQQISIVSPNNDYVKISVELEKNTNAKFLKKYYGLLKPVITSEKSHLMLEGPLKEVNAALKNLTVDLDNLQTCNAEMTVIDEMNPAITVNISDIKNYFRINQAPSPNSNPKKFVQRQVDTVPVYTGQYFTITLDQDTIIDENIDVLNYKLISKGGEANDTIPSWITFEGLTMRGTAPEQFFDRNIEFVLIASNEFKKVNVEFKIHLKISSTYVAKMIMKYCPYILTMIGLYIKANKIYNILCKRIYRPKKDFYVGIGKEITGEVISPIAFIQEERIESEIIWKHLFKRVLRGKAKNLLDESIGKGRILELIKETVNVDISQKERKNLKIYSRGADSRKKIVNQLIINKMVDLQLNKKEEKSTKRAYEKVKDQWPELVNWNLKSSRFKTDLNKLYAILNDEPEENLSKDLEENLLSKSKGLGVNLYLLSCALEAYTFSYHVIDRFAIRCNVQIKEKTKKNCFQSFFKFDIETMNMNSQLQVNYGISCRFENDSLVFSGVPCDNFRDKILVVEIANRQHKILKEIWIYEKNSSRVNSVENSLNPEVEEQHYEVF